jgi:hypothetical protein
MGTLRSVSSFSYADLVRSPTDSAESDIRSETRVEICIACGEVWMDEEVLQQIGSHHQGRSAFYAQSRHLCTTSPALLIEADHEFAHPCAMMEHIVTSLTPGRRVIPWCRPQGADSIAAQDNSRAGAQGARRWRRSGCGGGRPETFCRTSPSWSL